MSGYRFGVIGAGNMAGVIVEAAVSSGTFDRRDIVISNRSRGKLDRFEAMGLEVTQSNRRVVQKSDVVLLAVKPQTVGEVLEEVAPDAQGKYFVTIAAGITTEYVSAKLGGAPVMRLMPNTPMLVGCGATAVARPSAVPEEVFSIMVECFRAAGEVCFLPEELLNLATAVSGSGPAFFFKMVQAMTNAAMSCGMDEKTAAWLVTKTMEGSALMLRRTGKTPDELIAQVRSPNGTTHAGLLALDDHKFSEAVESAVHSSFRRACELGKIE